MGDRAPLSMDLAVCPADQRAAVAEILDEYGITQIDWTRGPAGDAFVADEIFAGMTYTDDEASLGVECLIAEAFAKLPGVVASAHQDAKYEYDGMTYYVVDGKQWGGTGSNDGEPAISAATIEELLDAGPDGEDTYELLVARLRNAIGGDLRRRFLDAWSEATRTWVIEGPQNPNGGNLQWTIHPFLGWGDLDDRGHRTSRFGPDGWTERGTTFVTDQMERFGPLPADGTWVELRPPAALHPAASV